MPICWLRGTLFALLTTIALCAPAVAQQGKPTSAPASGLRRLFFLTDNDVVLPVTSVEYGMPDHVSFTTRYIHMFQKDRDYKANLHNFTITVSPGTAGGRLGAGYENIHGFGTARSASRTTGGFTLLSEVRVVTLRTWGEPVRASAHQRFVGAEVRTSLAGVVNAGVGYYRARSPASGDRTTLWGIHVGFGI